MNTPKPTIDFAIGGQALIEGVMMRSPSFVTAAVRKKDGSIKKKADPFASISKKIRFLKLPIIRGVVNLIEMMMIGMKAINFSAEEYAADFEEKDDAALTHQRHIDRMGDEAAAPKKEEPKSGAFQIATMVFSFIVSLAMAIFLFKFIPLAITEWLRTQVPYLAEHYVAFNLVEGLLRICAFLIYIGTLSMFKSFHRIFEYHGAEHMAVHAYEKGKELTVDNVRPEHPEHPRCGTSFILAVFIVSILVYSLVPRNPIFWMNLLQRILVIPLIAGLGYEVLKGSAKHREHPLMKIVVMPGLLTQKITTQRPDDEQIEVAITALKEALKLEQAKAK